MVKLELIVLIYARGRRTSQAERLPPEADLTSVGWIEVMPGIWRLRVGTPEKTTPASVRFIPPAVGALDEMGTLKEIPLGVPHAKIHDQGITVRLLRGRDENIYGFGLQMLSFNQRGRKKTLRVNADPRSDIGDSHAPIYVSSRGYAVLVDTARYATFCCGNAETVTEQSQDPSQHSVAEDENEDSAYVTVRINGASGVDIYLFDGPTMLDAVRRYNLFSGGGVVPPEWGLGVWYRTYVEADDKIVLELANEFREHNIPCDVIGLEPGWLAHSYSCSFRWSDQFPSPAEFVKALGKMGFKVNLWEHAFVHPNAPFHSEIKPYCGDYLVCEGLTPDFSDARARAIFGQYHRTNFIDIGISGFKLDECDNSDYTGGWSFPEFSQFPSGQNGEQMHSIFGLTYQRTILEQFRSAGMVTYGQVRSSGALAAPYPFVLYSDLYDHRMFIRKRPDFAPLNLVDR